MIKRVALVAVLALIGAAAAVVVLQPETGVPDDAPSLEDMARDIGAPIMGLLQRGHVAERSGELTIVSKPNHYLTRQWDLRTLGTDRPILNTTHPNPWNYLTRVPIVARGPGFEPGAVVEDVTDIAAMAPTYADMLGVEGMEADSDPLPAYTKPTEPPKAIVTLVLDGGGWNVLREHPDAWPQIGRIMDEGTTYVNATIGSAPATTGALHATFGTGAYPRSHGLPANLMRDEEGELVDVYLEEADPRFVLRPSVGDLWDVQTGNQSVVATVSYEGWHLGMIGQGAAFEGGDNDVAVLWEPGNEEEGKAEGWWINEEFYELPSYLAETDIARLETYESELDERDGLEDETWFGQPLDGVADPKIRPATPAFVRFTGDAVMDVIEGEGIGTDDVADLLWVEFKPPDFAGHLYNMINPQVEDVLAATDAQVGRIRSALDAKLGRDNYVIAISADHGQQPIPDLRGGWRINTNEIAADVDARFGEGLVQKVTPFDIFFDLDAVEEHDVDMEEVARYLGAYTIEENIPDGLPGMDRVPESRLDETVFAGAFTGEYLESLTPDKLTDLGAGTYPESNLLVPQAPTDEG